MKQKRINFYGGPGSGKSTLAAATFAALKMLGVNCELVTEYAKDAAWEGRSQKFFRAQEHIFGEQHFRLSRLLGDADIVVTDAPILMSAVYMADDHPTPSLRQVIREAHHAADNLDILIVRNKPYNPKGRVQTLEEAKVLDVKIKEMLDKEVPNHMILDYSRHVVDATLGVVTEMGWIKEPTNDQLQDLINYHDHMSDLYASRYPSEHYA